MPALVLKLFGPPIMYSDGQALHIGRRKALALLAYLAVTGRSHTRIHLAHLLWPEFDEAQARGEVRRAVSSLNRILGVGVIIADRDLVALSGERLTVDVLQFRERVERGRRSQAPLHDLLDTADLAEAEFLAGFYINDAFPFEEWQQFERTALQRDLAWLLEQISRRLSAEDVDRARAFAARWLALDPLNEAAQRWMIECHARLGDHNSAYHQYHTSKLLLADELGVPISAATTRLYEAIRDGTFPLSESDPQPIQPAPNPRPALPAQPTLFVGRAFELAELRSLLHNRQQRLITITGPGGIGKTRLALRCAHDEAERTAEIWPDGIYVLDLAAIDRGRLVIAALAQALRLPLDGIQPAVAQLSNYLRAKRALLIFDNLEQLLHPDADEDLHVLIDTLLIEAPQVSIIATSRERLKLPGEMTFPLLGLPFPTTSDNALLPVMLEAYDAIRLFVQSAQRADPRFQLHAANQQAVLEICRLLQGVPLAIDLAAAWVAILDCGTILQELRTSLAFLTAIGTELPERHRSLWAAFHHSWQLLSPECRHVFAALACFRGGFTRNAAGEVADADLTDLALLCDKSLIRRTAEGRFVIHELLRQFAAEHLAADPHTAQQVAQRHASYYLNLLIGQESAFLSHARTTAYRLLQPEVDNVRAAWNRAIDAGRFYMIAPAIQAFYILDLEILNSFDEGIERFSHAITALQQAAPQSGLDIEHLIARIQARLAMHYKFTGRMARATALFHESLATLYDRRDEAEIAFVLSHACLAHLWQGELDRADQLAREGLALYRRLGTPGGLQAALTNLGYIAQQAGNFAEAEALNQECLALLRQSGDPDGLVTTLGNLGLTYFFQERYEAAWPLLAEAVEISRTIENRSRTAVALTNLMEVEAKLGRFAAAQAHGQEARELFQALGQRQYWAILECNLGFLALTLADHEMHAASERYIRRAEQHFTQSLRIAQEIDLDLVRVYGLTGFGELYARAGAPGDALLLLHAAVDFPTTDPDIRARAEARLRLLAQTCPAPFYNAAQTRARRQSLAALADQILHQGMNNIRDTPASV